MVQYLSFANYKWWRSKLRLPQAYLPIIQQHTETTDKRQGALGTDPFYLALRHDIEIAIENFNAKIWLKYKQKSRHAVWMYRKWHGTVDLCTSNGLTVSIG